MLGRLAAITLLAIWPTAAQAMSFGFLHHVDFIEEGAFALAPLGHAILCARDPGACAASGHAELAASTETFRLLRQVNRDINRSMRPVRDRAGFGDTWEIGGTSGDCEDFALTKRAHLIALGLPASSLRIALATVGGEPHAVLIARTHRGDYVLDNLRASILPWRATRQAFTMIQSAADPRIWHRVKS
jgi:predicted transglutaminase-like cysteine proteinase